MSKVFINNIKYVIFITLFLIIKIGCDDRVASSALSDEGFTMSFNVVQPIASSVSVGEAVVGETQVYVLVTVLDAENSPAKDKVVSFSAKVNGASYGRFLPSTVNTNSDGQAFTYFDIPSGESGAVDNPTTPIYENATITAYLNANEEINTKVDVYASKDEIWPYTFSMSDPTPEEIILGDGTSSEISLQLFNRLGNPVRNVIVQFDAGQSGFIEINDIIVSSDTTDINGAINFTFKDDGNESSIGVASVKALFTHPAFSASVSDSSLVSISSEIGLVQECTYVEIPSSVPDQIVVKDGGGIESTSIRAKLFDDNENLIQEPRLVRFKLNPILEGCFLEEPGVTDTSIYTVNGIATVSVNSGVVPGTVRIEVGVDCDEDGETEINANAVPVIISSGAPYYIEPEYDPQSTEAIGGGFYQTQVAAIVYDKWFNPVEDSTYVYWTIDPIEPDTVIDAFVDGISFTANENLSSDSFKGVAYTTMVYSTDGIGTIGRVKATTFGANGDTVQALINEDEGDATLFFVPGQLSLTADATYHDFNLPTITETVDITITAILIDFYGNPVVNAPVSFNGTGVSAWREVQYETSGWNDEGINGVGDGDGCFTWRDYGIDDNPQTPDAGTFNETHDSLEVSEAFDDFGFDNTANTFDEGEGNGQWDGYSMIGCEPVVRTDSDGYARIIATFARELCIWQGTDTDANPNICTFLDFTASMGATLLIPEITNSDPLDIQLTRSQLASNTECP